MTDDNELKPQADAEVFVGQVCWFSAKKGYGFVSFEKNGVQQTDIFVHYSDVVSAGYKTLFKDQRVSFQIGQNKNGDPKAIFCTVIKPAAL